jgi:hypothetical protein
MFISEGRTEHKTTLLEESEIGRDREQATKRVKGREKDRKTEKGREKYRKTERATETEANKTQRKRKRKKFELI